MPATVTATAQSRLSRLDALSRWLPKGRTLSDEDWAVRHTWMVWLAWANAVGLFVFGMLQGVAILHSLFEASTVATLTVLGMLGRHDRRIGSTAIALALLTASAVSVHLSNGTIEAHFHFFVMIAVLSLYEDWLPFLAALGYVLLHHGVVGMIDPASVYNHPDALARPLKWALIHAAFVAAAGAANVLAWRLHEETRAHLRELATIVESSQDAILSISADGSVRSWNAGACRVFGWSQREMVGASLAPLLQPGGAARDRAVFSRVLAGEHTESHESEWLDRDGRSIPVRLSASPLLEGGEVIGASAIVSDITEARRAAEQLARERRRLTHAEQIGQMGNWEWDPVADRIEWSEQLYRLFGVTRDEFKGDFESYLELIHPEDRASFAEHVERVRETRVFEPREHRIALPGGEVRHVLARGEVVVDDEGEIVRMMGTAVDITDRRLAEDAVRDSREAMAHQALHDGLTGLPNRTLLQDRLQHALQRSRRDGSQVALLFLDIDRFKIVNDSLGHASGDELLIQIAGRLDGALRPMDSVARFGGDELAVLCEDMKGDEGVHVAERVMEALRRPFDLDGREFFATASIGVAFSGEGDTDESLLRDADAAMYRAKELGGARYELFDAAMRRRSIERMQTEHELRRALGRGELRLHYQPIVALEHGTVIGAEALIRWQHPERGLLSPAAFIPLAEETTLIVAIGGWVLREACTQVAAWGDAVPADFSLSVNVSARQFADPGLLESVMSVLRDTGIDPGRLSLELTETVLIQQEGALETLTALKEAGVRVVLDDFGTGYSSLSYLSRFPLDGLKVDRSFVANMREGSPEHAIVVAVGTMAGAMNLEVVAEGIENETQRVELTRLGYEWGQGFLFARPEAADDFAAHLGPAAPATAG